MATLEQAVTAAAPKNMGEIARLLDELNSATLNLQDNTSGLSESLRPILRNEPQATLSDKPELASGTDLGQFLVTLIGRVQATNTVVADARNRLEL